MIVGSTADGAKGMSTEGAEYVVKGAIPDFRHRIDYGLSSGEGLVHRVRDAAYDRRPAKKGEEADEDGMVEYLRDPGVEDKRVALIETEFSSVLVRKGRQGSTLTESLLQAWDGKDLGNLVRTNRERATGAHVSVIGHITPSALRGSGATTTRD